MMFLRNYNRTEGIYFMKIKNIDNFSKQIQHFIQVSEPNY